MQDINNKLAELVTLLTQLLTRQGETLAELKSISAKLDTINDKFVKE